VQCYCIEDQLKDFEGKTVKFPSITHQQFAVLSILTQGEVSGQQLRDELANRGERKSGPAFYQFMARLEEAGFVKGWYEQKLVHGQAIKERRYRITGSGERVREHTVEFYTATQARLLPQGG
jgi:DNA-binding PadR family transcriptional regulator